MPGLFSNKVAVDACLVPMCVPWSGSHSAVLTGVNKAARRLLSHLSGDDTRDVLENT